MYQPPIHESTKDFIKQMAALLFEQIRQICLAQWPTLGETAKEREDVLQLVMRIVAGVTAANLVFNGIVAQYPVLTDNLNRLRELYEGNWPAQQPPLLPPANPADISKTFDITWQGHAKNFIEAVQQLLAEMPLPNPNPPIPVLDSDSSSDEEELSILSKTIDYSLYAGKELAIGTGLGIIALPRMILNLGDALTGMYTLVRHPILSAQAIVNEAYERPWRTAGNILGGYLTGALLNKYFPKSGGDPLKGPNPGGPGGTGGFPPVVATLEVSEAAELMNEMVTITEKSTQALNMAINEFQQAESIAKLAQTELLAAQATRAPNAVVLGEKVNQAQLVLVQNIEAVKVAKIVVDKMEQLNKVALNEVKAALQQAIKKTPQTAKQMTAFIKALEELEKKEKHQQKITPDTLFKIAAEKALRNEPSQQQKTSSVQNILSFSNWEKIPGQNKQTTYQLDTVFDMENWRSSAMNTNK